MEIAEKVGERKVERAWEERARMVIEKEGRNRRKAEGKRWWLKYSCRPSADELIKKCLR